MARWARGAVLGGAAAALVSAPGTGAVRLLRALRESLRGRSATAPRAVSVESAAESGGAVAPRALLVEGGASVPPLAAALASRGFTIEAADGSAAALRLLSGDVDGFDLLVVCATSHEDGDVLVRTVRRGGETALAVVVVTSSAQPTAELERAGADAVLDRSLGAELIARASAAVLARKRERRDG